MIVLPMLAQLAMLSIDARQPASTQIPANTIGMRRSRHILGSGVGRVIEDLLEESELEVRATLVELPVMFTNENASSATFDFDRWDQHRSLSRYFKIPLGAFLGVTTRRISSVVLPLMLFSSGVCLYGQAGINDPTLPTIQLPLQPFELTAPALGLLLVFRSDNAFSRFRTGSELSWDITTNIRSAMRRLRAMSSASPATDEERQAAQDLAAALLLLHNWIMNEHLVVGSAPSPHDDLLRLALGGGGGTDDRDALAEDADTESLTGSGALLPYHGIEAIALGVRRRLPSLTDQEYIAIEECLEKVTTSLGQCERLLRTPIPLGYTRYSVRFLWIWLTLLPFALTRTFCGFQAGTWWEGRVDEPWPLVVSSVAFISSIFLSIEDISVQIEEPFAVLPLDAHHRWLVRDDDTSRKLAAWASQVAAPVALQTSASDLRLSE